MVGPYPEIRSMGERNPWFGSELRLPVLPCRTGRFHEWIEAQVFNACYDQDRAQPARYSSGAIDGRQLARRLVSNDLDPFR